MPTSGFPTSGGPSTSSTGRTGPSVLGGLNPSLRVPTLVLDDGRPIGESGAILWYFGEGTRFVPTDRYERAQVLQWMFFEQYDHEPAIAVVRFWIKYSGRPEAFADRLEERMAAGNRALAAMERHLDDGRDWFVGDAPSLADIALYGYTHVADEGGFELEGYPAIACVARAGRRDAGPRFDRRLAAPPAVRAEPVGTLLSRTDVRYVGSLSQEDGAVTTTATGSPARKAGRQARKAATPWGSTAVVQEAKVTQQGGNCGSRRSFSSSSCGAGSSSCGSPTRDGVARRGPVTLRRRDLERLGAALDRRAVGARRRGAGAGGRRRVVPSGAFRRRPEAGARRRRASRG